MKTVYYPVTMDAKRHRGALAYLRDLETENAHSHVYESHITSAADSLVGALHKNTRANAYIGLLVGNTRVSARAGWVGDWKLGAWLENARGQERMYMFMLISLLQLLPCLLMHLFVCLFNLLTYLHIERQT